MFLDQMLDRDAFYEAVENKLITLRNHPTLPLRIANYSDSAAYGRLWSPEVLASRGLILDNEDKVLARPWTKFFNLSETGAADIPWDARVEVTDKMDGSLGILYPAGDDYAISTRGSFDSDQAKMGTAWIRGRYLNWQLSAIQHFTFLMEIIYPLNRIVISYGDFEGLVMLGCVEIKTGYYYGPAEAAAILGWTGKTAEVMPYKSIHEVLAAPDRENTEGYVIRAGSKMVKHKRPDYIELHRLISYLSEKSVFNSLREGKTVAEICEPLPDELHAFVEDTAEKIYLMLDKRQAEIDEAWDSVIDSLPVEFSRREFAFAANAPGVSKNRAYLFQMLDEKPTDVLLYKEIGQQLRDDAKESDA